MTIVGSLPADVARAAGEDDLAVGLVRTAREVVEGHFRAAAATPRSARALEFGRDYLAARGNPRLPVYVVEAVEAELHRAGVSRRYAGVVYDACLDRLARMTPREVTLVVEHVVTLSDGETRRDILPNALANYQAGVAETVADEAVAEVIRQVRARPGGTPR